MRRGLRRGLAAAFIAVAAVGAVIGIRSYSSGSSSPPQKPGSVSQQVPVNIRKLFAKSAHLSRSTQFPLRYSEAVGNVMVGIQPAAPECPVAIAFPNSSDYIVFNNGKLGIVKPIASQNPSFFVSPGNPSLASTIQNAATKNQRLIITIKPGRKGITRLQAALCLDNTGNTPIGTITGAYVTPRKFNS
jgi:hypothetical protein